MKELEEERNSLVIEGEEELKSYFALIEQWREMKSSIRDIAFAPRYALPFLQPGRIVRVLSDEDNDDEELSIGTTIKGYWGVIVNFEKVATATKDFVEEGI